MPKKEVEINDPKLIVNLKKKLPSEKFVGQSPFAVLLGDTICTGNPNCTKGLVEIFKENPKLDYYFALSHFTRKFTLTHLILSYRFYLVMLNVTLSCFILPGLILAQLL